MPFTEKRVDRDRAAALEMVRLSHQQGVPVIAVGDQVVVGFNRPRLEQLLAGRGTGGTMNEAGRPSLGAQIADAAKIMMKRGAPVLAGAYVGGVRAGSPAERAGLRAGDIITAVNQHLVRVADDVARALAGVAPNSTVRLTVLRQGRQETLTVEF